jgi:ornithine cyclodeaminase/alanine dehydrogenase-like protein (mu-crystallin family)
MDDIKPNPTDVEALVLTRSDIARTLTVDDYFAAAEEAFRAIETGHAIVPSPLHIAAGVGGFHGKGARLRLGDGADYAAVKINGNFPGNPKANGLPTIQGVIVLSDAANGRVLALTDSIEITLRRTAAATALAATRLARQGSDTLTIVGCGDQAMAQLNALASEFRLHRAFAYDIDRAKAAAFAVAAEHLNIPVEFARDMRAATRQSDMIVTCTTATAPFLDCDDIKPGTFIAAVGADWPAKNEIAPRLMARAKVVTDILEQCAAMGDLHHALAAGVMTKEDVHASLGTLIVGQRPGRETNDEITLFDSTGTAAQDVAAAIRVYERARAAGAGSKVCFNS